MLYYCKTKLAQSQPTSPSQQPNDAPEANCNHYVNPQFANELGTRSTPLETSVRAEAGSESSDIIDIGRELRQARERLAWNLAECAAYLKIRPSQLGALEEGRLAALPGLTYALGFLRAYAIALGLDADTLVRRFRAAAGRAVIPPALVFPTPQPTRGAPAGALALLGLVLAIGVYVAWYRLSAEGRLPAEVVPPVPERLASLAGQVVPPMTPPSPTPAPAMVTPPAVVPSPPPTSLTSLPEVPPTSAAAAMPSASALTSNAPAENDGRILLRARSDAWIQVREKDGPILLTRILRAGETWPVPDKAGLLLTTGNAGGTELVVDGVVAPSLGGNGAVRRDQPLDPDLIKEGKLPAQLQAANLVQGARPVTP